MRKAFSVLEILVVLAVLAVLVSLLLPAVQRVREAANQAACTSNLKNLSLACLGYESSHGTLPLGINRKSWGQAPKYADPEPWNAGFYPWSVRILPYIDESPRFSSINWSVRPFEQDLGGVAIFQCPSHTRPGFFQGTFRFYSTCYLGVAGTTVYDYDGAFPVNHAVRMVEILDGASNTLLLGERPPSSNGWWGWWAGGMGDSPYWGNGDNILCTNGTLVGYVPPRLPSVYEAPVWPDVNDFSRGNFWSQHNGGAMFSRIDGSVAKILYNIGQKNLEALGTIH